MNPIIQVTMFLVPCHPKNSKNPSDEEKQDQIDN